MGRYLYGERSGIYIIDLEKTLNGLEEAYAFASDLGRRRGVVLFVGTKKQAQEVIAEHATRVGMPYVTTRWLGGMLTNFMTIKKRIGLLEQLEARQQAGDFERMSKKEAAKLQEELAKLSLTVGGMRKMKRVPGAVFIVDPHRERIAVTEANKLEIPVVATGDTNVDPDEIDHIIPANDDAIRAIRLLCTLIADACVEGQQERAARASAEPEPEIAAAAEPEFDESASDELVAALQGGAALTFEPDADEEDLLPGARPVGPLDATPPAPEATPEEIAAELAREAAEKEEPATAG
jgi:small subunit ribosomal protein S2